LEPMLSGGTGSRRPKSASVCGPAATIPEMGGGCGSTISIMTRTPRKLHRFRHVVLLTAAEESPTIIAFRINVCATGPFSARSVNDSSLVCPSLCQVPMNRRNHPWPLADPEIQTLCDLLKGYPRDSMTTPTSTYKAQVTLECLKEENTATEIGGEHSIHLRPWRRWKHQALNNLSRWSGLTRFVFWPGSGFGVG